MTDITNRLRSDDPNPSIREAAAATIDALRAELNRVSKALRKERAENHGTEIAAANGICPVCGRGPDND